MQTTAMVLRTVYWLITQRAFAQEDILVTGPHAAQVSLLKAMVSPTYPGVRVYTVDASQEEEMIQVVNCVRLGGANPPESMGFLGGERRRFNVGFSRGMASRIVICHKDFVKSKATSNSPWQAYIEEAVAKHWVLPDSFYHGPMPEKVKSDSQAAKTDFLRRAGFAKGGQPTQPAGLATVVGSTVRNPGILTKQKSERSARAGSALSGG